MVHKETEPFPVRTVTNLQQADQPHCALYNATAPVHKVKSYYICMNISQGFYNLLVWVIANNAEKWAYWLNYPRIYGAVCTDSDPLHEMKACSLVLQKYASVQADNHVLTAWAAQILFQREGKGEKGEQEEEEGNPVEASMWAKRPITRWGGQKVEKPRLWSKAPSLLWQACRSPKFSMDWLMKRLTKQNLQMLASSLIHAFGSWRIINSYDRKTVWA